jgi:hypothetical protein
MLIQQVTLPLKPANIKIYFMFLCFYVFMFLCFYVFMLILYLWLFKKSRIAASTKVSIVG